jgi:hypothetical protein
VQTVSQRQQREPAQARRRQRLVEGKRVRGVVGRVELPRENLQRAEVDVAPDHRRGRRPKGRRGLRREDPRERAADLGAPLRAVADGREAREHLRGLVELLLPPQHLRERRGLVQAGVAVEELPREHERVVEAPPRDEHVHAHVHRAALPAREGGLDGRPRALGVVLREQRAGQAGAGERGLEGAVLVGGEPGARQGLGLARAPLSDEPFRVGRARRHPARRVGVVAHEAGLLRRVALGHGGWGAGQPRVEGAAVVELAEVRGVFGEGGAAQGAVPGRVEPLVCDHGQQPGAVLRPRVEPRGHPWERGAVISPSPRAWSTRSRRSP